MKDKSNLPVFFCIPDLTGFTRFITSTDSKFSQKVIPDLLNKLIACNILNMSVAEIEGDAIFFYRTGRLPAVSKVAQQCKEIYKTFNESIISYQESDPDNYHKYLSDHQLGLKIVIHYGHISMARIKGRVKLLGEDVILVHKLLKNSITVPSYILLTEKYTEKLKNKKVVETWFNWKNVKKGTEQYEHFGTTNYSYIAIKDCKI